jgi:hypothetical protein
MTETTVKNITVLKPFHTSFETAFLIEDYPFGFRLRCQKKVWIETDKKKGQRLMEQTTNPRNDNKTWNKVKMSTYSEMIVLFIDNETGYLESDYVSEYNITRESGPFLGKYEDGLTRPQIDRLTQFKAANIANSEGLGIYQVGREKFYTRVNEILAEMGRADLGFVKA